MSIRIHGNANQGPAEVDPNTLALYLNARPDDFQTLGHYSVGISFAVQPSKLGASGTAITNFKVLGFQWTAPNVVAVIKKIICSVGSSTAATAGVGTIQGFFARGYTQQFALSVVDSSAAAANILIGQNIITGSGNMLRSAMPPSLAGGYNTSPQVDNAVAGSAGTTLAATIGANIVALKSGLDNTGSAGNLTVLLTGATATLDAQPFGSVSGSGTATIGTPIVAPSALYDARFSEYPLVLDCYSGFQLTTTMPGAAASTQLFQFSFIIEWEELASPSYY